MSVSPRAAAIDELRQMAGDIGRLHGVSPVEIIVYAAAFELLRQMPNDAKIQAAFQEAVDKLRLAGA
jgi:hypothetical protein